MNFCIANQVAKLHNFKYVTYISALLYLVMLKEGDCFFRIRHSGFNTVNHKE
jgi:hypothetical protein